MILLSSILLSLIECNEMCIKFKSIPISISISISMRVLFNYIILYSID